MEIPGRVLLDTNVINFILDWGRPIFENEEIPSFVLPTDVEDILALRGVFQTGQRASWQLAISPVSYREIMNTRDPRRRDTLETWFADLWTYWRWFFEQDPSLSDSHAESLARRVVPTHLLKAFPQPVDRELICHAIAYGCDGFCTRDRNTILMRSHGASGVPPVFLSPLDWWQKIVPYPALWY